jgi:hypothetical protein
VRDALAAAAANLDAVEAEWKGSAGPCHNCEFGSRKGINATYCKHPAARRALFDPVKDQLVWIEKEQRVLRRDGELCGPSGSLFRPLPLLVAVRRWIAANWWWMIWVAVLAQAVWSAGS